MMIKDLNDTKIKFARLAYSASWNLGDHIQTLATERFLGCNPINIERDKLSQYEGEKVILLMQGYFFVNELHCSFPPSSNIIPVFTGFHIEDSHETRSFYSSVNIIEYLRKYAPIGCRDESTMKFLENNEIEAYFTRCLTLTFPCRDKNIKGGKIFFIDEPEWLKPSRFTGKKFKKIYESAHFLTQVVDEKIAILSDEEKRLLAIDRIELLKNEAKLVVTSRLHIAAPCIAMGIPVVLIPRTATPVRYEAIKGLIPMYDFPVKCFSKYHRKLTYKIRRAVQVVYIRFLINWNPIPPNIEKLKSQIIANVNEAINKSLNECL